MHKHGHHKYRDTQRIRKYLVVALAFFFFFALSNYFMGFIGGGELPTPTRPPVKDPPTRPIVKPTKVPSRVVPGSGASDDGLVNLGDDSSVLPVNNDDGEVKGDNNGAVEPEPIEENPVESDSAPEPPAKCKHTRSRDYEKDPIVISGRFSGKWTECDVPCVGESGNPDAVVGYRAASCGHVKSIFFTMENSIPPAGAYDIVANTQLHSDVPLPYFNWVEYNFKYPVRKKTAPALIAAFISNCGPQRRLQWMDTMMKNGVTIDSYGACMRNKAIPQEYTAKYGGDYNALKIDIISRYKFVMSFENSATDDYVTEKLFGVLAAGSVPLYDGASNGKKFGPTSKSMIYAADYGTPEKLAEYLLYLDKNDTAYMEYLQWKKTGPTDDWVSLIDLGNVHSNCRLCIRTADLHRKDVGPVKIGQPKGETKPKGSSLEIHVRERGKFWLRPVYLVSKTMAELKKKIDTYVPHDSESYLHSIHELWSKKPIKTDADVRALSPKTELEAIYVIPQNWESLGLLAETE
jgi:hypothetical protein